MDLRQLRYFMTIAERGSFSAAAQVLHVAQSALSRHVQLLEHEFGGPLFERSARGVRVNESGAVLLERARLILGEVENLRTDVSAHNRELTGTVRIAAPPTLADFLFIPIAQHFSRVHPRVTLQFKETLSNQSIDDLLAGATDLALVTGPPKANDLLRFVPKITERVFVFGPPGDPLLAAGPLRVEDIGAFKLVRSAETLPLFHAAGLQNAADGFIQTDSVGMLRNMVKAGLGYGILTYAALYDELASGEVSAAELVGLTGDRFLALPARRSVSRATREVVQVMDDEFARQSAIGRLNVIEHEQTRAGVDSASPGR